MKTKILIFLLFSNLFGGSSAHSGGHHVPELSLFYVLPFIGMLLSIAVLPLVSHHFWEKNYGKIAVFWALAFYIPFLIIEQDFNFAVHEFFKVMLTEYFPFIILLFSLYTISGGILLRGSLVGSPKVNTIILAIGTCFASLMGTTGAAMLLIRPLIRANKGRKHKVHTMIFFIFLVANIGGSLTPLGDPPLFIGFLKGIDFFWTTQHMLSSMLFVSAILMILFYFIDTYYYNQELDNRPFKGPINFSIEGKINFLLLLGVISSVILSGIYQNDFKPLLLFDNKLPISFLLRDIMLLSLGIISYKITSMDLRKENGFSWFPIMEVAKLFAGIFITVIPALSILGKNEEAFSSLSSNMYFWLTGSLSGFLDNAPTYLVFFTSTGKTPTQLMNGSSEFLLAISTGAVFMGAMTYIGNAPNFMVRSIAEENGIKMPSFFGYMAWSCLILIPIFLAYSKWWF